MKAVNERQWGLKENKPGKKADSTTGHIK